MPDETFILTVFIRKYYVHLIVVLTFQFIVNVTGALRHSAAYLCHTDSNIKNMHELYSRWFNTLKLKHDCIMKCVVIIVGSVVHLIISGYIFP